MRCEQVVIALQIDTFIVQEGAYVTETRAVFSLTSFADQVNVTVEGC